MKKFLAIIAMVMLVVTMLPTAALADETVTIHAQVPADWAPTLWAWTTDDAGTSTNLYAAWPGEALEANGDCFEKEIPATVNNIIISNNGSPQTADIAIEAGKDLWITVNADATYEISYEDPAGATDNDAEEEPADTEADTEADKAPVTGDVNGGMYLYIALGAVLVVAASAATVLKKRA